MWFSVHNNNNIVQGELTRNSVIKSLVFGLFTCSFFVLWFFVWKEGEYWINFRLCQIKYTN